MLSQHQHSQKRNQPLSTDILPAYLRMTNKEANLFVSLKRYGDEKYARPDSSSRYSYTLKITKQGKDSDARHHRVNQIFFSSQKILTASAVCLRWTWYFTMWNYLRDIVHERVMKRDFFFPDGTLKSFQRSSSCFHHPNEFSLSSRNLKIFSKQLDGQKLSKNLRSIKCSFPTLRFPSKHRHDFTLKQSFHRQLTTVK